MKRYFSIVGYVLMPFIVSYTFWYVIGAGISASWDTANWTADLKMLLGFWSMFFGLALFVRIEQEYK